LPLIVRSFDESGNTIDENSEDAYVTIVSMTGPNQYSASWTNPIADSAATVLTLTMYP
jgi:hypothetical protein